MATVSKKRNTWAIYIRRPDGSRYPVTLPEGLTRARAEIIAEHITDLEKAVGSGIEPATETRIWLSRCGEALLVKLGRAGLVQFRQEKPTAPLGLKEFVTTYIDGRSDLKPGSKEVMRTALKHLLEVFPAKKPITDFTREDALKWRKKLLARGLMENTIRKSTGMSRQFFKSALDQEIISKNPFDCIPAAVRPNRARMVFIPQDTVRKIMDVVPCPQWRLLLALARWGGLRIPSETLALTWSDVDFEGRRFIVRSTKTEAHADGGIRIVPMFDELVEPFLEVFEQAEPGGEPWVITRYRSATQNLRTQLTRWTIQAGLVPWTKPWVNMRSSRATELADEFPGHVVSAWLGHSERIADLHYRGVTDAHFARATGQTNQQDEADGVRGVRPGMRAGVRNEIAGNCTEHKTQ